MSEPAPLLQLQDLAVHFHVRGDGVFAEPARLRAVDGVSLSLLRGKTLGLVGESGCGKTTLGKAVAQLYRPSAGRVLLAGHDLTDMWRGGPLGERFAPTPKSLRQRIQMIFQDPYGSLNPRMTVEQLVSEPLRAFRLLPRPQRLTRVQELLGQVGLDPSMARRYPHEFSGGQRQRIGIARAIAAQPELIVCDEPTSALDVSVRAQVLNLLGQLQQDHGYSYLFVTHDLSAVRHMAQHIAVMYLGKIVELGPGPVLCAEPRHPYTQALLAAVPVPDPSRRRSLPVLGEAPSPLRPPSGCAFHPRCPEAQDLCREQTPQLHDVGAGGVAACHLR